MTLLYSFTLTYRPTGETQSFTASALRSELIHHGFFACDFTGWPPPFLGYSDRSTMVRAMEVGQTCVEVLDWRLDVRQSDTA